MPFVALVVPCYNEEHRLDVEAFRRFSLPGTRVRIILVDDGSRDGTRTVIEGLVRDAPERFQLVALPKNEGKAEAVRQGMLAALEHDPDYFGYWDADLSTSLEELGEFVDLFRRAPDVDIVFGARVMVMGRVIVRSQFRHYAGRVYATVAASVLSLPIYDTQCGAKLFRVNANIRRVIADRFLVNWTFDVEILARCITMHPEGAAYLKRALHELPLRRWVEVGGSKVTPTDFGRALRDLWLIQRYYLRGR